MAIQFTRNGRKAMLWAQVEAMRRGEEHVEREHLLLGLLHGEKTGALRLLSALGCEASELAAMVGASLTPEAAAPRVQSSQLSPRARAVVEQARRETEATGHDFVGTEHLLLALLRDETDGMAVLREAGLSHAAASAQLAEGLEEPPAPPFDPRPTPRPGFLKGRHLLSVLDLSPDEVEALFELTREIKLGQVQKVAAGKSIALLFDKPSLRTRVSFQVAMTRLGGESLYLSREEVGLGQREAVKDVARVLSRMVEAIVVRTSAHETVMELAEHASVPVINALDDYEHPCQALADFYTIREHRAQTHGQKLVFLGDGNNVAVSLMLLAPLVGTHFTLACPPGYEPPAAVVNHARELSKRHGTRLEISHDPIAASDDADILYTDVWTSMGKELETKKRLEHFPGFAINEQTLREAKEDALVLHCLPAHRGEEITDEAMESSLSKVFDQAENRLHVQQSLLAAVL